MPSIPQMWATVLNWCLKYIIAPKPVNATLPGDDCTDDGCSPDGVRCQYCPFRRF